MTKIDLGTLRKPMTPAILGIVAVIVQWIVTAGLDVAELRTAGAAVVTALAVYLLPNDSGAS
jgi:hypothetical protein